MEQAEIIKAHPSICYNCIRARKPAADSNLAKGWVGCAEYAEKENFDFIKEAKELGEGWVDLRSPVFGSKSGVITNLQLLTLEVKECKAFSNKIW